MLELINIKKAFNRGTINEKKALNGVNIKLDDGVLTISGEKKEETTDDKTKSHVKERRFGSFMRSMTLPEDADAEHISASSKDGVLTISIPRKAPEKPQARTIT